MAEGKWEFGASNRSGTSLRILRQWRLLFVFAITIALAGVGMRLGVANGADPPSYGFSPSFIAQLPAAKQAVVNRSLQAAGIDPKTGLPANAISPSSKPAPPSNLAPVPSITSLPSGITNNPQPPFSAAWFESTSMWSGDAAGKWWWVFAGSASVEESNSGQGGLVLLSVSDSSQTDASQTQQGPFFTDDASIGPLTITGESGSDVTLQTPSGRSCEFDLSTLTFSGGTGC
jgi:hypothetical protein